MSINEVKGNIWFCIIQIDKEKFLIYPVFQGIAEILEIMKQEYTDDSALSQLSYEIQKKSGTTSDGWFSKA